MFLLIVPCVCSTPDVSRVSKLSQTGKEDKELNKKAKNPEVGKLTEADKASTGRVGCDFDVLPHQSNELIIIQPATV